MKNMIICLFMPLLFACGQQNSQIQDVLAVNWEGLNLEEFALAFGDEIMFGIEGDSLRGVIVDFSQDEGGKWYGICFLRGENLFGTRVPAGFTGDECVDLLDVCYLNEKGLKNYSIGNPIELDERKISVGVRRTAEELKDLTEWYELGITQRKNPPSPCGEDLLDPNRDLAYYHPLHSFTK